MAEPNRGHRGGSSLLEDDPHVMSGLLSRDIPGRRDHSDYFNDWIVQGKRKRKCGVDAGIGNSDSFERHQRAPTRAGSSYGSRTCQLKFGTPPILREYGEKCRIALPLCTCVSIYFRTFTVNGRTGYTALLGP